VQGLGSEWRLGREDEDECRESVLVLKNAVDNYGCCTLECLHAVFSDCQCKRGYVGIEEYGRWVPLGYGALSSFLPICRLM
jgi:hypothetical protein